MANLETDLTLIGGPTVLIECFGLRLLTDPTFDEPGTYDSAGIVFGEKIGTCAPGERLGHGRRSAAQP